MLDVDSNQSESLFLEAIYTYEGGVEFWSLVYDAKTDTARIVCELIDSRTLSPRPGTEPVVLKRVEYPVDESAQSAVPDYIWERVPGALAERRKQATG